jgi:hypothetical protein
LAAVYAFFFHKVDFLNRGKMSLKLGISFLNELGENRKFEHNIFHSSSAEGAFKNSPHTVTFR